MKPNSRVSLENAADDYIDACYAEWLMEQPEAMVTGGDVLVQCMEAQWGWDRFTKHFNEMVHKKFQPKRIAGIYEAGVGINNRGMDRD